MICPACMEFTQYFGPSPFHRNPNLVANLLVCWRQIDTLFIAKTNEIGKYQKCCELGAAKRLNKQTIFSTLHFASLCVLQPLPPLPLSHTSFCGKSTERAQRCDFVPFCTPHSLHSTVHSLSLSLPSLLPVSCSAHTKEEVRVVVCVCWHWAALLVHRQTRRTVGPLNKLGKLKL